MLIKDIPLCERPRERMIRFGASFLSNEDLLSILIRTGTKNKSVKQISLEILKDIEKLENMRYLSVNRLKKINGIGVVKAIELIAAIEFGRRVFLLVEKEKGLRMNNSKSIFEYTKNWFFDKKQEYFYVLYFNNKQELIEEKLLFIGTVNKSIVHPREIFKHAYLLSASSIVCIHNHPSGDILPSKEDISFTRAIIEIGIFQNIPVVDHIIIGNNNYYSFSDNGNVINT